MVELICLVASVALLAVPTIIYIIYKMVSKIARRKAEVSDEIRGKSGISRMLIFSACLLGSVWCLRFAVGFSEADSLNCVEEIFNSFVHALQTFSMDEDYTDYIISGKEMLFAMLGRESAWQTVYGIYAAVLNLVAPIAGGAIVFEIIAGIFPKIRLYLMFWKDKYYFSELNEASLALAKSIVGDHFGFFRRPAIIFTDVYVDDESEKDSELLLDAKRMGAICIKDDLAHIHKTTVGIRKFFLIDENESNNLHALTALANSYNNRYIKNSRDSKKQDDKKQKEKPKDAEVYLFTNDDAYIQVEKNVRSQLRKMWDYQGKEEDLPFTMIPVKSYRNMITNLLSEQLPLYEPLIGKEKVDGKQSLTVTILGTGDIGVEMFLTTYWIGQILDCALTIRVLSQETEEQFWNKIDNVNPEIRKTIEGGSILRINRNGDMAEPYCTVKYQQCDVKSSKFVECFGEDDNSTSVLDTDYYFVALGSDEDDLSVANTIRRYVGQHHIAMAANQPKKSPLKTVIAYVVYDSELSKILNREKMHKYVGNDIVYTRAVGSLGEVYSEENVLMTRHTKSAESIDSGYNAIKKEIDDKAKDLKTRIKKDDYTYWANLARALHARYKEFSAGIALPSVIDGSCSEEGYQNALEAADKKYLALVTGKEKCDPELLHKLAWLEHRRWNAFMRVKGFRWNRDDNGVPSKDYDTYAAVTGSYKQMELKLHPCLVECDKVGIRVWRDNDNKIGLFPMLRSEEREKLLDDGLSCDSREMDYLDELSFALAAPNRKYNSYDFKIYDYPMTDKAIFEGIELSDDYQKAAEQTARILCETLPEEQHGNVKYDTEVQYKVAKALGYQVDPKYLTARQ